MSDGLIEHPAMNAHAPASLPFFAYGETETGWLSSRDAALGSAISRIGRIDREVIPDLFTALVNSIVAQQISTKAHVTVWSRITGALGDVTPERLLSLGADAIQKFGMSGRKARYIHELARRVGSGEFVISDLASLDAGSVCTRLCALDGIGVWTAEMLMIFSMQRPDILSFGDAGIRRGLCLLHGLSSIDRAAFESYRKLYSPYGSVASLYLWKIAAEE